MDSYELALELGQKAKRRGVTVATAESCTAGVSALKSQPFPDQASGTNAALSRIRTVLKKRCLE